MPKIKTSKSVRDRFKITSTGKVLRRKVGHRHLKAAKRRTNIRRGKRLVPVIGEIGKKIKLLLSF